MKRPEAAKWFSRRRLFVAVVVAAFCAALALTISEGPLLVELSISADEAFSEGVSSRVRLRCGSEASLRAFPPSKLALYLRAPRVAWRAAACQAIQSCGTHGVRNGWKGVPTALVAMIAREKSEDVRRMACFALRETPAWEREDALAVLAKLDSLDPYSAAVAADCATRKGVTTRAEVAAALWRWAEDSSPVHRKIATELLCERFPEYDDSTPALLTACLAQCGPDWSPVRQASALVSRSPAAARTLLEAGPAAQTLAFRALVLSMQRTQQTVLGAPAPARKSAPEGMAFFAGKAAAAILSSNESLSKAAGELLALVSDGRPTLASAITRGPEANRSHLIAALAGARGRPLSAPCRGLPLALARAALAEEKPEGGPAVAALDGPAVWLPEDQAEVLAAVRERPGLQAEAVLRAALAHSPGKRSDVERLLLELADSRAKPARQAAMSLLAGSFPEHDSIAERLATADVWNGACATTRMYHALQELLARRPALGFRMLEGDASQISALFRAFHVSVGSSKTMLSVDLRKAMVRKAAEVRAKADGEFAATLTTFLESPESAHLVLGMLRAGEPPGFDPLFRLLPRRGANWMPESSAPDSRIVFTPINRPVYSAQDADALVKLFAASKGERRKRFASLLGEASRHNAFPAGSGLYNLAHAAALRPCLAESELTEQLLPFYTRPGALTAADLGRFAEWLRPQCARLERPLSSIESREVLLGLAVFVQLFPESSESARLSSEFADLARYASDIDLRNWPMRFRPVMATATPGAGGARGGD